ncbi:uncharacterized protein LOC116347423 [Contarinia nasturtii]|uniref:uncharacterized protein LOC116347423 n=1 Tax=Contarinia nasturtii TaxID=265458 RepID=UPI0012D3E7EA|nr:uncharacterized protein LOC116347423 [Contarinia nasturtii]
MVNILYILSFCHLILTVYGDRNSPSIEENQIKNFTKFLENSLNKTVLEYTLKSLTKPGDNFGAVLRSVVVKVADEENDSDENDIYNVVMKTPVTNPILAKFFKPAVTFVNEVRFYTDIIPALEQFEEIANVPLEERLDALIPCLGSRFSLNSNAEYADSDAILLLENIKFQNFTNVDKHIGFNTNETLAILKVLAKYHALGIAIRRLKSTLYNTKIDPYTKSHSLWKENDNATYELIYGELKRVLNLTSEMSDAVDNMYAMHEKYMKDFSIAIDTPYTTVVHGDLWFNNIMIRKDTKSIKVKIYDFQTYFYESFVFDLSYFLFTSVGNIDLNANFTLFVDYYISEFQKMMNLLKCPMDDYTHEKMWHEFRERAKFSSFFIIFHTKVANANYDLMPSLDKLDKDPLRLSTPASKAAIDQWKFIIDVFMRNGLV